MLKFSKIFVVLVVILNVLVFSCSAQVYTKDVPSYCINSGGAWAEVVTQQGNAVFVVGRNYIYDTFSYLGRTGYNVLNSTSNNISGVIYFKNNTSYFGNPRELQCRFNGMSTLEVYEPYQTNYGGTSYRWTSLPTSQVLNTNIGFIDNISDRYNNSSLYSRPEKLQIIIICLVIALVLYFLLGRSWRA